MGRNKISWKGMVDGALFLLLLNQMGYVITGQQHHEGTGTVMVLLVLCHNLLNRRWFGAVGKGKYNSRRLFGTALNFLTIALMSALFISGVIMSRYVFDFLPIRGGKACTYPLCVLGIPSDGGSYGNALGWNEKKNGQYLRKRGDGRKTDAFRCWMGGFRLWDLCLLPA